jgi:outer membrane murein-binding lipoprotein Lpp
MANLKSSDKHHPEQMKTTRPIRLAGTALLAAVLLSGCESDDPKIQQEVTELRAKVAELEKQLATRMVSPARAEDSISRETLRRNLDNKMPALRATLTKAFPDYRIDPVSAATVSIPQDSDYLPYSTEVCFGLSQGQTVASFSIRIGADRAGNWQLPDLEDLAASVGNLASSGALSQGAPQQAGLSGRGATMNNNVRQIEWNNAASSSPIPADNGQAQPDSAPQGQSQPAGNAPFPVQDTRRINFD